MPKLIAVLETRPSNEIHNLLNAVGGVPSLPEGVEKVAEGVWTVEFPQCALFLAKILVHAEERNFACSVYELAAPSEWEFRR